MAVIGREAGVDIVLQYPQVSAIHASIQYVGEQTYKIHDLGSTNGTFINGRRIISGFATPADTVRLGSVAFDWNEHIPAIRGNQSVGYSIGREAGNDIVVNNSHVSAVHAWAIPKSHTIHLIDCGSRNGVFVNGVKVAQADIGPQDRVGFGSIPVDVFGLMRAKGLLGPMRPEGYQQVLWPQAGSPDYRGLRKERSIAPAAEGGAKPAAVGPPLSSRRRTYLPWAITGMVLILLMGLFAGFSIITRQDVVKNCEKCGKEIFRERAFFWQQNDAKRRADGLHWCQACGDEMVPYKHTSLCGQCGRPYKTDAIMAKRMDKHLDESVREGFCSAGCERQAKMNETINNVGDALKGVLRF